MAEELIEFAEYDTRQIDFKSTWVLEELKLEEVKYTVHSKYFIDFFDENEALLFSLGHDTQTIRNEFKSDMLMEESRRKEIQKKVLKSLFVDTFRVSNKQRKSVELRVNSLPEETFVGAGVFVIVRKLSGSRFLAGM